MKMNNHSLTEVSIVGSRISFQVYGVGIAIESEQATYLETFYRRLENIFPIGIKAADEKNIEHFVQIYREPGGRAGFFRNGESIASNSPVEVLFDYLESHLRVIIARSAVGKVFLHAGVVTFNGKAIVIPGNSFSGKTTLVAELVKKGAVYYSDEYAVLDLEGSVEPFPKTLSMRGIIDKYQQLECPVESFGGRAGKEAAPVGLVLLTEFKERAAAAEKFEFETLSRGRAMMEIIPHTLPIRNNPKIVLEVLNKLVSNAIIFKTDRGEAPEFAERLFKYLHTNIDFT